MGSVPQESQRNGTDDRWTGYHSCPDCCEHSMVTDTTAVPGWDPVVLSTGCKIIPRCSMVSALPSWFLLEENDRTGT